MPSNFLHYTPTVYLHNYSKHCSLSKRAHHYSQVPVGPKLLPVVQVRHAAEAPAEAAPPDWYHPAPAQVPGLVMDQCLPPAASMDLCQAATSKGEPFTLMV